MKLNFTIRSEPKWSSLIIETSNLSNHENKTGKLYELTIEKCVEVVVIHLAQFEKVFTGPRAELCLEVDDNVTQRSF